jgi:LmbE family N-acetylglucosaminyl deacetylase
MLPLTLKTTNGRATKVLCLGAHADDIEIGCAGTMLQLLADHRDLEFHWVVFSATGARAREARSSAPLLLARARRFRMVVKNFRDGFFPYHAARIKTYFEKLKATLSPDLIFTHYQGDRHQDHRLVSELTWNTFRNHLILEYEVPKYDGDLGSPNAFVPLDETIRRRKTSHLWRAFPSQRRRPWFSEDTFAGLMRLRGIESGAPGGYAEAFYTRKLLLGA